MLPERQRAFLHNSFVEEIRYGKFVNDKAEFEVDAFEALP